MGFKKATKEQSYGRLALFGPSGSGKTYTALRIASGMGKKIAVVDTENGSASKYADKFDFDVMNLTNHSPASYISAIQEAEEAGYDVIIIDSLSHAWSGAGGVMEMVDNNSDKNKFTAWKEPSKQHKHLIDAMTGCAMHVIATMRAKTKYEITDEDKGGKITKKPVKIGLAPEQREGMDYEFDVLGLLNQRHVLTIDKTRCDELDGMEIERPGEEFGKLFLKWLREGIKTPFVELSDLFRSATTIAEITTIRQQVKTAYEGGKITRPQLDQLAGIRDEALNRLRRPLSELIDSCRSAESLNDVDEVETFLADHKDDYTTEERQSVHKAAGVRRAVLKPKPFTPPTDEEQRADDLSELVDKVKPTYDD